MQLIANVKTALKNKVFAKIFLFIILLILCLPKKILIKKKLSETTVIFFVRISIRRVN